MPYLLIRDEENLPKGLRLLNAIEVDICSEDGTLYDSRFTCPTCYLRRDPE